MADLPQDPIPELKAVLSEHLPWHGARIGFGGPAKVESHYKRLQRFFRAFEIAPDSLARLRVRLIPLGGGPWRLTLDRTNWQFGQAEINVLVLGVAHRGMAAPLFWSVLDQVGSSDTAERIALLERFLAVFGASRIAALLADREFVGEDGFQWLQRQGIPFHQRLKRNPQVPNRWSRMMRLDRLFGSLRPGPSPGPTVPANSSAVRLGIKGFILYIGHLYKLIQRQPVDLDRVVVDPVAVSFNRFAGDDGGGRTGDGNEITVAFDFDPEHAEAGFLAVECHPLDGAGEAFSGIG
jgi:hypothetical protein